MNISAMQSFRGNELTSFGKEYQVEDAEQVMILKRKLNDSFQKTEKPEHKSIGAICASVTGAILTMFILGKCVSSRVMNAFPFISEKLYTCTSKRANFVRHYSSEIAKGNRLKKGGKYTKLIGEFVSKSENFLRKSYIKLTNKGGAENLISNMAGIAAVATVTPDIISVDGNNDGISDIAQKNVNAYKNALKSIGILSEIVEVIA